MYDIVIVHGPCDDEILPHTVAHIRKYVQDFRKIFIISHDTEMDLFLEEVFNGCVVMSENVFPFSIDDIDRIINTPKRNGWYFQQLIKLYISLVIPEVLDDYVIVDSDTLFLREIRFKSGPRYMLNMADECHDPYFHHMKRVHPSFRKMVNLSGIAHHMIFNRQIISEMIALVENHHNSKPFWEVYLSQVAPDHRAGSGASEYELYFNYMLQFHKKRIIPRKLRFENTWLSVEKVLTEWKDDEDGGPYYASLHAWMVNRQPRPKVKNTEGDFVLVYIGYLREFVYECIQQIKLWNPCSTIHLCINRNDHNKPYVENIKNIKNINIAYIEDLEKTSHHDHFVQNYTDMSMNGFWRYTMERFFVIEECMRKLKLRNVFHLEIDNMVYFKVEELLSACKTLDKILIPSDSEMRYIAGTCFINDADSLSVLNRYFAESCINNNEMHSIMNFTKISGEVDTWPVLPSGDNSRVIYENRRHNVHDIQRISKHSDLFAGVFDAAAVGQYFGGIDPIHQGSNSDGFVNTDSIFGVNRIDFKWHKIEGLQRLYMRVNETWHAVYNLHIHNKNLKRWLSDLPEMTKHLPNIL